MELKIVDLESMDQTGDDYLDYVQNAQYSDDYGPVTDERHKSHDSATNPNYSSNVVVDSDNVFFYDTGGLELCLKPFLKNFTA